MSQICRTLVYALGAIVLLGSTANADEATFSTKSLKPETALTLAQATLTSCRDSGYQVAVAVVDRGGNMQVMLRDRFAGPHTVETARRKAWTAMSFRANTSQLAEQTQPGQPQSGTRGIPNVLMLGGGMIIENGDGELLGAIGVSGAPGGDLDDACAQQGLVSIEDLIAF